MSGNQSYMGGGYGSRFSNAPNSPTASVYNAMGFNVPQGMGMQVPQASGQPGWNNVGGQPVPMGGAFGGSVGASGGPVPGVPMGGGMNPIPRPGTMQNPPGTQPPGVPPWGSQPTWQSNPLLGALGMGGGPGYMMGWNPMNYNTLNNWIGSMYNPRNMLYNQGVTDAATKSKGGTAFTGYPPPIAPTTPGSPASATATGDPAGAVSGAVGMNPRIGTPFTGGPGVAHPLGTNNPANDRRALAMRAAYLSGQLDPNRAYPNWRP